MRPTTQVTFREYWVTHNKIIFIVFIKCPINGGLDAENFSSRYAYVVDAIYCFQESGSETHVVKEETKKMHHCFGKKYIH